MAAYYLEGRYPSIKEKISELVTGEEARKGRYTVTQEFLILYKPNVRIPFSSALEEVTGVLDSSGFKLSTSMSGSPVYNGTAWISKIDQVAIHFEFSDMNTLDSILIQNETYNDRNFCAEAAE